MAPPPALKLRHHRRPTALYLGPSVCEQRTEALPRLTRIDVWQAALTAERFPLPEPRGPSIHQRVRTAARSVADWTVELPGTAQPMLKKFGMSVDYYVTL
jgi:hypothetical protein